MKLGLESSQILGIEVSQTKVSNLIRNTRLLGPTGVGHGFRVVILSKANNSLAADKILGELKTC
jgi:hypothetical protein